MGEAGLPGDDVEVGVVGADVAGGEVAPAERLDEPAVGAQQRLGLVRAGVADDHRLAAAEVQPGEAVLVRHGPRQPQRVGDGVVLGGVRVEAGAAQRRPQRRRVDGDDRPQSGLLVAAEDDLLVARAQNVHGAERRTPARTPGASHRPGRTRAARAGIMSRWTPGGGQRCASAAHRRTAMPAPRRLLAIALAAPLLLASCTTDGNESGGDGGGSEERRRRGRRPQLLGHHARLGRGRVLGRRPERRRGRGRGPRHRRRLPERRRPAAPGAAHRRRGEPGRGRDRGLDGQPRRHPGVGRGGRGRRHPGGHHQLRWRPLGGVRRHRPRRPGRGDRR